MLIDKISIRNFRNLKLFDLDLNGNSVSLVSENAAGKTSLLLAIAKAMGKDRNVSAADFADLSAPIEIIVQLSGFTRAAQGPFPTELSFAGRTPSLRVGFRAEWSIVEEEGNVICGFPDHTWRQMNREQRDALRLVWLPAYRDPVRLLQLAGTRGFWERLFETVHVDDAIKAAIRDVNNSLSAFTNTNDITALMTGLRDTLSAIIPEVDPNAFTLGVHGGASAKELLREFEVLLSDRGGTPLPVHKQSNGLIQLAVFVFALKVAAADVQAIVLVDEPEISLHPQAQRSLASAFRKLPNQLIVATHSPSILDRADLRSVVRLRRNQASIDAVRAKNLTDSEALRLARFVNPLTAEACFARKVVLVEGYSDRVAVLHLAHRVGRDMDAEGVTVISLDGGSGIGTYLKLFGEAGLKLHVSGVCDEDKEARWILELRNAGLAVADRLSMSANGFEVCVADLEQEFVRALGLTDAQAVIANEGEANSFALFQRQPATNAAPLDEQLRRFFHQDPTRWAVPLVDALNLRAIPRPLNDLLGRL